MNIKRYLGFGVTEDDFKQASEDLAETFDMLADEKAVKKTAAVLTAATIAEVVLLPWHAKRVTNGLKVLKEAKEIVSKKEESMNSNYQTVINDDGTISVIEY